MFFCLFFTLLAFPYSYKPTATVCSDVTQCEIVSLYSAFFPSSAEVFGLSLQQVMLLRVLLASLMAAAWSGLRRKHDACAHDSVLGMSLSATQAQE